MEKFENSLYSCFKEAAIWIWSFLKPYVNITTAKSLPKNLPSPPHTAISEILGEGNTKRNDLENAKNEEPIGEINPDTINMQS